MPEPCMGNVGAPPPPPQAPIATAVQSEIALLSLTGDPILMFESDYA